MEIDLLALRTTNEIWIVEVKSSGHEEFQCVRLSFKQQQRLKRAALQLIHSGFDVQVVLALVLGAEEIQWVDAFSYESLDF